MAEKMVVDALQRTLCDLIDLSLVCKQYHWNIQGPRFRELHLALDEVVDLAREQYDEVAERIATIGAFPDGRADTVSKGSAVDNPGEGPIAVDDAYPATARAIQKVADRIKSDLDKVDDQDSLSGDILRATAIALEQQAWFFRASA